MKENEEEGLTEREEVRLAPSMLADLDALAKRWGWPRARFIREGIRDVLAKYAQKRPDKRAA